MADDLEEELRDVGSRLRTTPAPDAADVTRGVRARLESRDASRGAAARLRWMAAAAVIVLAVILAGTPAGRAAVVDMLRFAGVEVRHEPGPVPVSPGSVSPGTGGTGAGAFPESRTDLADARERAEFPVYVPRALGRPDGVDVSGDSPRRVTLLYRDGGLRLDEFAGEMPYLRKFAARDRAELIRVDDAPALWVPGPHSVVYVDRQGVTRTEAARLAGNTLIWQVGDVTLRLEGEITRTRAVAVAESLSS